MKFLKSSSLVLLMLVSISCWGMKEKEISLDDLILSVSVQEHVNKHDRSDHVQDIIFITYYDTATRQDVMSVEIFVSHVKKPQQLASICSKGSKLYNYLFRRYEGKTGCFAQIQNFEIKRNDLKGRGLEMQLFEATIKELVAYYSDLQMCYWGVHSVDGEGQQDALLSFYRQCGACELKAELEQQALALFGGEEKKKMYDMIHTMSDIFYIDVTKKTCGCEIL